MFHLNIFIKKYYSEVYIVDKFIGRNFFIMQRILTFIKCDESVTTEFFLDIMVHAVKLYESMAVGVIYYFFDIRGRYKLKSDIFIKVRTAVQNDKNRFAVSRLGDDEQITLFIPEKTAVFDIQRIFCFDNALREFYECICHI